MRTFFIIFIAVIVSIIASSFTLASESLPILPEELLAYANNNGCNQVNDFFKRPGIVNPPYIYRNPLEPEQYSAALWCQIGSDNDRKYFLLVKTSDKNQEWSKCPAKIEWPRYPGGLSLYNEKPISLKDFVFLSDPRKKGPENARLEKDGIMSEYDGVEELLYCYKGDWLIRRRH